MSEQDKVEHKKSLISLSFGLNNLNEKKNNNPECKDMMKLYSECIKTNDREHEKCIKMKIDIDKICKEKFSFN